MKADIDTQIEDAIIFSAKHAGLWDESLENGVRAKNTTHLYLDIISLKEAIKTLLDTAVQEARIELATDLLRKVKLEYEAGGRYSGHIILPWEEIVRPELVKLKSTSKEDK